jgi:hypothetical protein
MEHAESTARSSFNADMDNCAGPAAIAAHTDSSTIHAGSSRDSPAFTSM